MSETPKHLSKDAELELSAEYRVELFAERERPFSQKWHERNKFEQSLAESETDSDPDKVHSELDRCRLIIKKLEIKCDKLTFQNDRMANIIAQTLRTTANHSLELIDRDRDTAETVERMAVLKKMFRVLARSYVLKIGTFRVFSQRRFAKSLKDKNIFDSSAYLAQYSDVNNANIDPILHFVAYGISEGRDRGF